MNRGAVSQPSPGPHDEQPSWICLPVPVALQRSAPAADVHCTEHAELSAPFDLGIITLFGFLSQVCRDGSAGLIPFRMPAPRYSRTSGMGLPVAGDRAMSGSNRRIRRLKTNDIHECPHLMQIMAKLSLDAYVDRTRPAQTIGEVIMIVVNEKNDLLEMHVYGELTLADYRGFEEAVGRELKTAPKVKLLLDLAQMTGYTLDVAWEEIKFTRSHAHDFRRIDRK